MNSRSHGTSTRSKNSMQSCSSSIFSGWPQLPYQRDSGSRQDLQPRRIGRDREGEHAGRVVALGKGRRQRYVDLVAVRRRGRELLAAADDDAVLGLLDDVEGDLGILGHRAALVLGLLAAVDLRVAQRMGQEQVVALTVFVIIL